MVLENFRHGTTNYRGSKLEEKVVIWYFVLFFGNFSNITRLIHLNEKKNPLTREVRFIFKI